MKKILKRTSLCVVCVALALVLVRFGPNLYARIFGNGNTVWISERFSETLKEKNNLVVYEVETTGQETVSQDAWLIGTVQKVVLPYTFHISFTVDLSQAKISLAGNTVEVRVPSPVASYHKLTVNEDKMKKSDWLYPLTPERYSEIKKQLEERLFQEYSVNPEYQKNAWGVTVKDLETLFGSIVENSEMGKTCDIHVIRDDTASQPLATDADLSEGESSMH
ncbi:MAG: DUF4230 domain-containing protein [Clostridia bacterium]